LRRTSVIEPPFRRQSRHFLNLSIDRWIIERYLASMIPFGCRIERNQPAVDFDQEGRF
jgi:hypothetical protein